MTTKIKICGITNVQDANWVSALGCEYIGLNFVAASPRKISVSNAVKIVGALPPFIKSIGVFANAALDEINKTLQKVSLSGVQLHGDETAEFCSQLRVVIASIAKQSQVSIEREIATSPSALRNDSSGDVFLIKTFRVRENWDTKVIEPYEPVCDFFLFDTFKEDSLGGTGGAFNWDALLGFSSPRPFFLAGGLTPENVTAAVKKVRPYAVDVASGVESSPRRKDFEKMKSFVTAVISSGKLCAFVPLCLCALI